MASKTKLKGVAKYTALAGLVGVVCVQFLSDGQITTILPWAEYAQEILGAGAAIVAAFLLALRKRE